MESKKINKRIVYFGYIFLLSIPIVQNDLRYYYCGFNQIILILLGSLPNFLAAFSICSFGILISDKFYNLKNINIVFILATIVLVIYEIFQLGTTSLYFDFFDIIFTIIGSLTFKILYRYIYENKTKNIQKT